MSPPHDSWCMLDNFFSSQRPLFSLSTRTWSPPVDVSETPDQILIRLEVAGVAPGDFSVTLDGEVLSVRGRRCDVASDDSKEFHAKEIRYGCFERTFRLPGGIAAEKIQASYQDGFLEVEIPKGAGKTRSIQITVRQD